MYRSLRGCRIRSLVNNIFRSGPVISHTIWTVTVPTPLSHTCCGCKHMDLTILNRKFTSACIRNTNAKACILHTACNTCARILLEVFFNRFQSLDKRCIRSRKLSVRKHLARTDRILITDLPWEIPAISAKRLRLHSVAETALCHTEPAVCASRNIICINTVTYDVNIMIVVGSKQHGYMLSEDREPQRDAYAPVSE